MNLHLCLLCLFDKACSTYLYTFRSSYCSVCMQQLHNLAPHPVSHVTWWLFWWHLLLATAILEISWHLPVKFYCELFFFLTALLIRPTTQNCCKIWSYMYLHLLGQLSALSPPTVSVALIIGCNTSGYLMAPTLGNLLPNHPEDQACSHTRTYEHLSYHILTSLKCYAIWAAMA